ncbi:MAG TPA: efflux RND transporter periplasmic adaptor subunit [Pseudomonadota bacterium]|nr:efflux RND transporter periplasmic adaptor subunit [Pseudomonadota bacterium]
MRSIQVSGNIEAHESVLSFQVAGRIVDLPVEEGKWVEKDAIVARLDDSDYRQQVAHDEATLKLAQAELTLALAGSREQEIEALRQSMLNDEAQLTETKLDYDRAEALYRADAASQQNRDLAETAYKRAQAAYEQARQEYELAVAGTRKETIDIARANVKRASEALQLSRLQLDHTLLRAPLDGVVVVRQAELGEVMAPGTPVITFADLDHVWMRAYVDETELGRVGWNQPATVSSDTFAGKTYAGRVSFIADKAEFTPKSVETHKERVTLVYRIKIDVDNPGHQLKPGMPVDAQIDTGAPGWHG